MPFKRSRKKLLPLKPKLTKMVIRFQCSNIQMKLMRRGNQGENISFYRDTLDSFPSGLLETVDKQGILLIIES